MSKNNISFFQKGCIEIVDGEGTPKFPYHTHNSFLIGVIKAGNVHIKIGNTEHLLSNGMIYLVPSNVGISLISDTPYSYLTICIKGYLRDLLSQYKISSYVLYSGGESICGLCENFKINSNEQTLFCELTHLLNFDKIEHTEINQGSGINFVRDAVRYIDEHIEEKINLDDIADAVHVSKYYLVRTFKKIMGVSPKQYALQGKMRCVKEEVFIEHSTAKIAADMNFAAQSHLCSTFKRYMGISIDDYKKNVKRAQ